MSFGRSLRLPLTAGLRDILGLLDQVQSSLHRVFSSSTRFVPFHNLPDNLPDNLPEIIYDILCFAALALDLFFFASCFTDSSAPPPIFFFNFEMRVIRCTDAIEGGVVIYAYDLVHE
jgi:hypothetical protein